MRLLVLFVAIMLLGVHPVDAQKKKGGKSKKMTKQEQLDSIYNAVSLRFEQKKQVYAKQDSAFWADYKIVKRNGMEVTTVKFEKKYDSVEQMPMFPGGDAKLIEWLYKNIRYPIIAEELGVKGRVIMKFVVAPDGSVRDVLVEHSVNPLLDMEAYRVVRAMPRWIPGKVDGEPVPVYFTLPVTFQLK